MLALLLEAAEADSASAHAGGRPEHAIVGGTEPIRPPSIGDEMPEELADVFADDEAAALYAAASEVAAQGPVLEIGSYCGKSTI